MSGMSMMPYQHHLNEMEMQQNLSSRSSASRNNQNTFVHKLGMLISDPKHSDLIFLEP
ncbi:hypothetical protein DSO57_1019640 [Entomophthora muscae]|uniref:Uncharacterized protein n=1 Tax=Entomophthora muscae TaxID=34485 RepID=A0ACC2UD99_9FUNG|nr:hypothetical protein DSO57_1019640 [Entomophthora muscae]